MFRGRTCPKLGIESARPATKNFRHLAGTKAKARWNATTADAPTEPTATHGAAAAKWDPRRVGYYRSRFQEETACLRTARSRA